MGAHHQNWRKFLLSGVGLALLAPVPLARAQAPVAAADQMEEIVVTARKRAERLQEVPSSGIALDRAAIKELGIKDGKSMVFQVPGAVMIDTGVSFDNEIIVRGAGAGRANNAEVAAGLYRNGAFIAGGNIGGRNFNNMDFFDVERVETLRGPQGALYGRNAMGGTINVVSRRPDMDQAVEIDMEAGSKERLEASVVANQPLGDNAAIRAGVLTKYQGSGFYKNSDGRVLDTSRFTGGRIGLIWKPTDRLQFVLTTDYFTEKGPSFAVFFYNKLGRQDPFLRNFRWPSIFLRNEFTGILETTYDFGDVLLTSTTYHRARHSSREDEISTSLFFPPPATVGLNFRADQRDYFRRSGQELRLSSQGEGPWTWMAGGEYLTLDDRIITSNFGAVTASVNNTNEAVSDDSSYSFFASVARDLGAGFNFGIESRYSKDKKNATLKIDRTRAGTNTPIRVLRSYSDAWSNFSPAATLRYKIDDDLMVYARYATAYRPGGFNDDPGGTDNTFSVPYEAEKIRSWELGTKTEWLDKRLRFNLAYFNAKTKGLLENQSQTSVEQNRAVRYITNAGNIEHQGLEAELGTVVPFEAINGRLRLSLAGARNWSGYETGPNRGRVVSRIRPWTVSGNANLTSRFANGWTGFVRWSLRGEWGGLQNTSLSRPQDDIFQNDAFFGVRTDAWNVTLSVRNIFNTKYDLDRLTSNTAGVDAYRINAPRTYSIGVGVNF